MEKILPFFLSIFTIFHLGITKPTVKISVTPAQNLKVKVVISPTLTPTLTPTIIQRPIIKATLIPTSTPTSVSSLGGSSSSFESSLTPEKQQAWQSYAVEDLKKVCPLPKNSSVYDQDYLLAVGKIQQELSAKYGVSMNDYAHYWNLLHHNATYSAQLSELRSVEKEYCTSGPRRFW